MTKMSSGIGSAFDETPTQPCPPLPPLHDVAPIDTLASDVEPLPAPAPLTAPPPPPAPVALPLPAMTFSGASPEQAPSARPTNAPALPSQRKMRRDIGLRAGTIIIALG